MQELPGPKMGLGPQPILARFARLTPLCYIGKILEKIQGPPLDQILDSLVLPPVFGVS